MAIQNGSRPIPSTPLDIALAERDAARQQVAQINTECVTRAMPRIGEFIDALNQLTLQSKLGNAQAKQNLVLLFNALEAARAAVGTVPILHR